MRSLEQVTIQLGHPDGDHLWDTTNHHYWSVPSGCISAANWSYMVNRTCLCGTITNSDGKLGYSFVGEGSTRSAVLSTSSTLDGSCGVVDMKSVKLWDSLPLYSISLQNAVLSANMLLGVHSYIQNTS